MIVLSNVRDEGALEAELERVKETLASHGEVSIRSRMSDTRNSRVEERKVKEAAFVAGRDAANAERERLNAERARAIEARRQGLIAAGDRARRRVRPSDRPYSPAPRRVHPSSRFAELAEGGED